MLPREETIDWIFDATRWWLGCFGNVEQSLVPNPDDFPVDASLRGNALASAFLKVAVEHTGLTKWPLVMTAEQIPDVSDVLKGMSHAMTSPLEGTPSRPIQTDEPLWIPYQTTQLDEPEVLIAIIARSISHYLLYVAPTPFPGDEEDRDYFVDLGAVLLGFGVFLANSAFSFQQTSDGLMAGWGYSRRGALSELDVSYALALAVRLAGTPEKKILRALKRNPKSFFKAASKHIRKRRKDELDALYETPSLGDGPYR